jgi:hypothetical protein
MNTDAKCKNEIDLPKGAHVVKVQGKTYYYLWRGGPRFYPGDTDLPEQGKSKREHVAERLLKRTARRAKERGNEFSIDLAWVVKELTKHNDCCCLTGIEFDYGGTRVGYRVNSDAPSIDRINNRQGYTRTNSRIVLTSVNIALNEWGFESFVRIAEAMVQRQGSIKRQEKAKKRVLKPRTSE